MEKSLFEQMGGTYTQVGDYLLPNLILPEQQGQPIGVWGQRHARYLKQHHKIMFLQIVKQLAKSEGITEELKAKDQTEWVAQMNTVCYRAREIVNSKLIFI